MGTPLELPLAAGAAFAAGLINALAGGGTLITFPTLTALGRSAITANTTNTVALCPGYFGGSFAQRADLRGQEKRCVVLTITGALGGFTGGWLLLHTGEQSFRAIVPWLLLVAATMLAFQGRIRRWIESRRDGVSAPRSEAWVVLPVFAAAVYGGYFGGVLGVILLATLALAIDEPLPRLNALKQTISLAVNGTAAILFVARAPIDWRIALVMAVASLLGGAAGGRLASRLRPEWLRAVAVAAGLVAAGWYFVKLRG